MKIAMLDDEPSVHEALRGILTAAGHSCTSFERGRQLIRALHEDRFDLFILDWNVPDMSGLSVVEWIRNQIGAAPPLLVLTSRVADEDVIAGFRAGADDFISKPINPPILLARVEALGRRSATNAERVVATHGAYHFDTAARRVTLHGEPVETTPKEFQVAAHLFRNLNVAVSRTYLLETIWGFAPTATTRTLDIHMSNLRRKLKLSPENGFILSPVYGYGYRLEEVTAQ